MGIILPNDPVYYSANGFYGFVWYNGSHRCIINPLPVDKF